MSQSESVPVVSPDEAKISIVKAVILTVVTCGIYNIFWTYKQMNVVNGLLGRNQFSFGRWLLLTLITCGIYHIYYEYIMATALIEAQKKYGTTVVESLPTTSIILSFFGLVIMVDAIQQHEINKIYESGKVTS